MHATYVPHLSARYRRPGGPWDVADLDTLLASRPVEIVEPTARLGPDRIDDAVARVAGGLLAAGVRRGRAVAWQLPNGAAAAILPRACWRIGAVAAPIHHGFGSAERDAALAQIDPAFVLDAPAAPVASPADPLAPLGPLTGGTPVPAGVMGSRPSDVAVVLFTSGSTGTPKAVLHTHRSLAHKAVLMARVHGLTGADTVLMPAPLAHISGLLNGILLPGAAGMRSVLMARFDPEHARDLIAGERVTFMAGPPTFFVAIAGALDGRRQAVASLRLVSSGGATVSAAFVAETAEVFGCRVKRTYGSTEAPTVTTTTASDPPEAARETDGRAVGAVELAVCDPGSGRRLAPGSVGLLSVRGPELFAGYANPAHNVAAFARGGWFRTGDLASVDDAGWLQVKGRAGDLIIRGGENIVAAEIEAVLESHASVRHAVVVGYPDPLMGERAAAFVVAEPALSLEECARWFAARGVARFKTPERVVNLDHLPLLGSGKPDRAGLRSRAAEPRS